MVKRSGATPDPRLHRWARALTGLYAVATIIALGETLFAHRPNGWLWEQPLGLLNVPVSNSFLSVVMLAVVTRALVGRKRIGLWFVAALQVIAIAVGVATLIPGVGPRVSALWGSYHPVTRALDVAAAFVALAMLFLLWRLRPVFAGRITPGSWTKTMITGAIGVVVTLGALWLLLGVGKPGQSQLGEVVEAVLTVLGGGGYRRVPGVPGHVVMITEVLAGLTAIAALTVFLSSARRPNRWSPERELSVRALLTDRSTDDSLGYFATRRDKETVFAPDQRAAVTYRVLAGVSLASADPIGSRDSWPAAIRAWLTEARTYGWQPAVIGCSETGARAFAAAGLRVLLLGDEAVLTADAFDRTTNAVRPVRRAAAAARRAGVEVRLRRQREISPGERRAIADEAHRWLQGRRDRGFSMALNRDDDPTDERVLVVTAEQNGRLVGELRFVPWGRRDVSLDLMRRAPDAPHGTTELMITELLRRADQVGVHRVSLNFCMFRTVFAEADRIGSRSLTRLNAGVLGILDRFWQLERLYRANVKFDPAWSPRFLCYPDAVALPQVTLAAAAAEGFVPWPSGRDRASIPPPELVARVRALDDQPAAASPPAARHGDQDQHRREVVASMRANGIDPYPAAAALRAVPLRKVDLSLASERPGARARVVGRVRAIRDLGGVVFVELIDGEARLQALLAADQVDDLDRFTRYVDEGDLVVIDGVFGHSRSGTLSLMADGWRIEAKALHPVPWQLSDPATRLRRRAADLIVHPAELDVIRRRSAIMATLRGDLVTRGFVEVETPILQNVHGGARARPFRTYLNAAGSWVSLRIAPELYLKQLLVGGIGPVFEIGRNFRNEGADASHNPEFTSLEAYQPGGDYQTMRLLTQELIAAAAIAVHGSPVLPLPTADGEGVELVDIGGSWPAVPMLTAVSRAVGRAVDLTTDLGELIALAAHHGVDVPPNSGPGTVLEELYGHLVEPATRFPTFYLDFPQETSPLTRPHRSRPGLVERWDLVAAGMELGTAYTELTDPLDQRRRLTEQSLRAAAGDPEAMEIDEGFLSALELGMPPSGGLGLGVDRLVMLLTNRPMRSVLSFPYVRRESARTSSEDA